MKKTNALILALTILIVLVVVNFVVSRHPFRFDLTEHNIYTLSDSTKKILRGLDDVVTIRAYFTADPPPALQSLRRDVDDILAEFKGVAGKRLQIEFVDPASSKMEEQKAMMIGIPPVQLNVVEKDKQEVAKVYLGMVVMFGGKQQVIPVIQNINSMEYDLTEAIIKVSVKDLPKVAWWMGKKDFAEGAGYDLLRKAMEKRYEVEDINEKNLAGLDAKKFATLILVTPRKLSDDELFALDQYVMSGGRLIALVDRIDVANNLAMQPIETNIIDPLVNYGITVEDSLVIDQQAGLAAFSGGYITYQMPYPYWPDIRKGQMLQSEPIVANLESVVLPWTSPLIVAAKSETETGILATTSQIATSVPLKDLRLDPQSAGELLMSGQKGKKPLIGLLNGPFKTYYSDKVATPKGKEVVKESPDTSRVFVVGSSRWISDKVLQNFPANAILFQNVLDSFAMGDMLIGIRSREASSRPIEQLSDGARAFIKYINLFIGPVVLIIIGLVLFMLRRQRHKSIEIAYK